jgi:predicted nuclease with TOPRIM domain
MNDAHSDHEPKDAGADRFPDFHPDHRPSLNLAALAAQASFNDEALKRLSALETNVNILLESAKQDEKRIALLGECIAALEADNRVLHDKLEIVAHGISDTEKLLMARIATNEAALSKQRAVNEVMLQWLNTPSDRLHAAHEQLATALLEALKS